MRLYIFKQQVPGRWRWAIVALGSAFFQFEITLDAYIHRNVDQMGTCLWVEKPWVSGCIQRESWKNFTLFTQLNVWCKQGKNDKMIFNVITPILQKNTYSIYRHTQFNTRGYEVTIISPGIIVKQSYKGVRDCCTRWSCQVKLIKSISFSKVFRQEFYGLRGH